MNDNDHEEDDDDDNEKNDDESEDEDDDEEEIVVDSLGEGGVCYDNHDSRAFDENIINRHEGAEDRNCDDLTELDIEINEHVHQQRQRKYKEEKQKLIDSGHVVVVDPNYNKNTADPRKLKLKPVLGAIVEPKRGQFARMKGILVERISTMKWKVEFEEEGANDEFVQVEMTSSSFDVKYDPNSTYEWKVVKDIVEHPYEQASEYETKGIVGFDPDLVSGKAGIDEAGYFLLFRYLWPGEWQKQLAQMNEYLRDFRRTQPRRWKKVNKVSEHEWWKFIGILLFGSSVGKGGKNLYEKESNGKMSSPINLGKDGMGVMPKYRLDEIIALFPYAFYDKDAEAKNDPWHPVGLLVDGYNANRLAKIASSVRQVMDEIMIGWKPRTSKTGNAPHISCVERKPRKIGFELKNIACSEMGT